MEKVAVKAHLRALNRGEDESTIAMYADLFADYREAQANIEANGTVVYHPKTGAPITNPLLAVRDSAMGRLLKMDLDTGDLWSR